MVKPKAANFTPRILSYKKFAYQEGNENDTKFLCKNGIVTVLLKVETRAMLPGTSIFSGTGRTLGARTSGSVPYVLFSPVRTFGRCSHFRGKINYFGRLSCRRRK